MTYQVLYFAHLAGLGLWLGALVAGLWFAVAALRTAEPQPQAWGLAASVRLAGGLGSVAALAVAGAGIAMMVAGGMIGLPKALWFKVMEMGGGMLAVVSVAAVFAFGRPLLRHLAKVAAGATPNGNVQRLGTRYVAVLGSLAVLVLGVLLAVSLRFS